MRKKTGFMLFFAILLVYSQLHFASVKANSDSLSFSFRNSITREVFTNYLSRAVTLEGFCVSNDKENLIFEEDLRMLRRTGAKFVASAAQLEEVPFTAEQLNTHFSLAEKFAKKVHEKDKDIILEAYLPEKFDMQSVESVKIPDWVFTAFQKTVRDRSFDYEAMRNPSSSSYNSGGYLYIGSEETRMFLYYLICRYIDAGFEAIFLGNAPAMLNDSSANASALQELLKRCRQYALNNAPRGLVFFDCKTTGSMPVIKIGEQLVTDFVTIPVDALETSPERQTLTASINIDTTFRVSGTHPLGFFMQASPVFLRFENYLLSGREGISNKAQKGCWGFNEITWLSLQPASYRTLFLEKSYKYLKESSQLDSEGKQNFFLQMPCKVAVTEPNPEGYFHISLEYRKGIDFHQPFFNDFVSEDALYTYAETEPCEITVTKFHRANRNGDGCPSGFDEENTIRTLFLGKDAPEVPELNGVILPQKYFVVNGEDPSLKPDTKASSSISSVKGSKTSSESKEKSDVKKSSSSRKSKKLNGSDQNSSTFTFSEGLSSFQANSGMVIETEQNFLALIILSIFLAVGIACSIYYIVRKK